MQNNLPGIILLVDFGDNFKQWIKIIFGFDEDTNFSAVTGINGNISKPSSIQPDCRQGDLIAKYIHHGLDMLTLVVFWRSVRRLTTTKST